jgi:hypothetical protein
VTKASKTSKHVKPIKGGKASLAGQKATLSERHAAEASLRQFIRLVNLLPVRKELPEEFSLANASAPSKWIEDRGKQFVEWVNTLPEQLKCYVLGGPIWQDIPDKTLNWLAVREAIHRYVTINHVREDLETVVWINQVMASPEYPPFSYPLITRASVRIHSNGTAQVSLDPFASALQMLDVRRIRRCENAAQKHPCRKIFLAARSDQWSCSRECAKKERQRKWRERYGKPKLTAYEQQALVKKGKRK